MGIFRGPKATLVTSDLVNSVATTGGTIMSQGNTGPNGGYTITFKHDLGGCGSADSGILILLKDDFSWNRMAFDWEGNGTAACWSFMHTSGFGASTGTVNGNMSPLDSINVDAIINPELTWEVSAYQSHNRVYACDNNANNFFRFNSSSYKKFRMLRTRIADTTNLAGIHHGRSCNSTGAFTVIKNIRIW
tara:strand:+ start:31 stop:600 length:570 start_codon:yes stop_codon:yes gene_type:complete